MENNVRLYTIDNEIIPNNFVTDNPSFFIMSFQNFAIKLNGLLPDSKTKIYSVVKDLNSPNPSEPYKISENKEFPIMENFAYTIFFDKEQKLSFDVCGFDGVVKNYIIEYVPENTHEKQVLFDDLITNNNLPTLAELLPCLLEDVNHKDILQRMLLDFKRIVNTKGTKKTIEKFFNFIGFGDSRQFHIFDEYISTLSGKPVTTITPNKNIDSKSGDYWVTYDNYETEINPFDKHNLPNRKIDIQNLDEFWIKLERAISLANIYFILPEQSINRFTLNNSVNVAKFQSIASNTGINFSQNVHGFNDKIGIYAWSNLTTDKSVKYLVSNNLIQNNKFGNTQFKYHNSPAFLPKSNNKELFVIEKQIYDNNIYTDDSVELNHISSFGCVMRLVVDLVTPYEDIWCEYTIENTINKLTKIHKRKFLMTQKLDLIYVSTLLGDYKITIDFYNGSNNRERYIYDYSVDSASSLLDFEVFSSVIVLDEKVNVLNLDISSPSEVTVESGNNILKFSDIPDDISTYFEVVPTEKPTYLNVNDIFDTPEINKNFPLINSTNMPVDYMDTFLDIINFKYNELFKLKIRITNTLSGVPEIVDYSDASAYEITPDILFITSMDIYDAETELSTPFYFITTRDVGVEINKVLFDLVLVLKTDENVVHSIFDIEDFVGFDFEYKNKKIPLNFDIPLFHRESSVVSDIENYPLNMTTVKSIYPRLMDLSDTTSNVNNIGYSVLLGDIFVCKIDEKYVTNMIDLKWEVFNSFTKELLYSTKDYSLKYRVEELIVFDVVITLRIRGGGIYTLNKKSLFTAYKINL
jgi:hypothetical protein